MSGIHPRWFYGWWVVLTCALGLFLGPIPTMVFSFGVCLKPLAREFHAGRGAVSLALTFFTIAIGIGAPLAGRLIDRFGARKVILSANVLVGLILLAANFCSERIWQLYLFYLSLGIFSSGLTPISYCWVVSRWFDRHRGLALGLMMLGLGSGALLMPPIAQALIARFGWRLTFAVVGAVILTVTVPILTRFLIEKPESIGLWPDGAPRGAVISAGPDVDAGLSWSQAWRTETFWLLFCAVVLVSASVQACFAHGAAILADRGATAQVAAVATSLFGAGLLVGRSGSGYLLDRFFAPRVAALIFACTAVGIGLLRVAASHPLAFVAAFFIGIGQGAEVDIMAYLISRYFGLRSFGLIYGFIFGGFGLAGGLGAYVMGASYDATGSYRLMLIMFCLASFLGAAFMLRLGPYRHGAAPVEESSAALDALPT
ncbi:MAG: MFS transporter [Silvibacterium sp.]|nr:MFS transporter [Silvibacterium sp.]